MSDLRTLAPAPLVRAFARLVSMRSRRSTIVESLLGIELDARSERSLGVGLAASGRHWGDLYRWKLERFAMLRTLQSGDGEAVQARVSAVDASCYAALDALPDRGILLALPHYGHFTHTVIGAARHLLARGRRVFVFYESPERHASNAIFDELGSRVFGGSASFSVIHNDRRGLLAASRGLASGGVVMIMPDVYAPGQETYRVPFGRGSRPAALGTAFLARRTDSLVVPCLSMPEAHGFSTRFGDAIDVRTIVPGELPIESGLQRDYLVTARLFEALHALMAGNFVPWQYVSSHFVASPPLEALDVARAEAIVGLLELELSSLRLQGGA